jgi:regulatory protein
MLSRREHSTRQVASGLRERGFAEALVEALLEELQSERLLDDERYAVQFVRARATRGQGPRRIRMELKEAGVDDSLVTRALETAPDFHAVARALRRRRFGDALPEDHTERARQSRFLQYRGFSNDHIASALRNAEGTASEFPDLSLDDDPS